MKLKDALKGELTKKQLGLIPRSFDIVGDIAIIEIRDDAKPFQKLLAKTILKLHKNIKVVLKKKGGHEGAFRIQKMAWLAGQRRKETVYKESGVRMKLHLEKTYFSPRYGTERLRIAQQIKDPEDVLVMFSGIAPFPLVIARNSPARHITAVEINPDAHKYAQENIVLNKFQDRITAYLGDARIIVPKLKKRFDRIAMPLPKGGEDFLDIAIGAAKKGAIIHFYDFLHEDDFDEAKKKVKQACKAAKKKCRILHLVKCGQQSPRVYRICVDFRVY